MKHFLIVISTQDIESKEKRMSGEVLPLHIYFSKSNTL